jgi:hypothetical protein
MPLVFYSIEITWIDQSGRDGHDFVTTKLSVPESGGSISELLAVPVDNPGLWPSNPTNPRPGQWVSSGSTPKPAK